METEEKGSVADDPHLAPGNATKIREENTEGFEFGL